MFEVAISSLMILKFLISRIVPSYHSSYKLTVSSALRLKHAYGAAVSKEQFVSNFLILTFYKLLVKAEMGLSVDLGRYILSIYPLGKLTHLCSYRNTLKVED